MSDYFYGLTIEELGLSSWNKIEVVEDCCLLFWRELHKGYDAFEFACVAWSSSEDCSDNEVNRYKVLFKGLTYFDGVRHLYFGDEATRNYGYHYYPNLPALISALKCLDDLQVERCKYVQEERLIEGD